MGEVSKRDKSQIIDIATTTALFDRKQQMEDKHLVKAAEYKLFDINSWVSTIND